jgi:hypothetical protein
MPITKVETPDGRILQVEHPEGASPEQIKNFARQQYDTVPSLSDTTAGKALRYGKRFASRLLPDAFEAAEGAVEAATHPIQTAEQMGDLAAAGFEKGGRKFEEFIHADSDQMDIPYRPEVEAPLDAVVGQAVESFGTPEAAIETITQHPADTLMTLAGFGPARVFSPIKSTLGQTRRGMGALADEAYRADMDIPKTNPKRRELSAHGARAGIIPTRKGFSKVEQATEALNDRLNNVVEQAQDGLPLFPKTAIATHFDDLIEKFRGVPDGTKAIEYLKKKRTEFLGEFPDQQSVTAQQLHDWKRTAYQTGWKKEAKGKPDVKVEAYRQSGRGAKESIQRKVEGYEEINDEWAKFAQLKPYVENRVNRPKTVDVGGGIRRALSAAFPGARAAVVLRKMADTDIAELVQKYSPDQVRYMLSKVNADDTATALWAAGQYDQILEDAQ